MEWFHYSKRTSIPPLDYVIWFQSCFKHKHWASQTKWTICKEAVKFIWRMCMSLYGILIWCKFQCVARRKGKCGSLKSFILPSQLFIFAITFLFSFCFFEFVWINKYIFTLIPSVQKLSYYECLLVYKAWRPIQKVYRSLFHSSFASTHIYQGWGNRNRVIVIVCNRLHLSK